MVIDKFLKVDSKDPRIESLRKKLAGYQQQAEPSAPAPMPTAPAPPPRLDKDLAPLQKQVVAAEQKAAEANPEFKLREERTMNLLMNQIKELITLHTEASKRIKDAEIKQTQVERDLELLRDKHEEMLQKMNTIDSRLEKFMGLYELVTNQYNPFTDMKLPKLEPKTVKDTKDAIVKVEDSLTRGTQSIQVSKVDQEKASSEFKKVEAMLSDLHKQHTEQHVNSAPAALDANMHSALAGFETRLQKYIDKALQERLHTSFKNLEQSLQQEVRDALKEEIAAVQADEKSVEDALNELQELLQANEQGKREPIEAELSSLTNEINRLQDDVKTIPSNMYFRVADGSIIRNVQDLRLSLSAMPDAVFNQHFGNGRNDFADWVEHALLLPSLAQNMRKAQNKRELALMLQPDI